jgi:hypothetical protein
LSLAGLALEEALILLTHARTSVETDSLLRDQHLSTAMMVISQMEDAATPALLLMDIHAQEVLYLVQMFA